MAEKIACNGCGSMAIFLRKKGQATGLYCADCGKWHKWVGKKEVNEYKHKGYPVHSEDYIPALADALLESGVASKDLGVEERAAAQVAGLAYPDELPDFGVYEEEEEEPERVSFLNQPSSYKPAPSNDSCLLCMTGVVDTMQKEKKLAVTVFEDTVMIRKQGASDIIQSFKINYCPSCGVKL